MKKQQKNKQTNKNKQKTKKKKKKTKALICLDWSIMFLLVYYFLNIILHIVCFISVGVEFCCSHCTIIILSRQTWRNLSFHVNCTCSHFVYNLQTLRKSIPMRNSHQNSIPTIRKHFSTQTDLKNKYFTCFESWYCHSNKWTIFHSEGIIYFRKII